MVVEAVEVRVTVIGQVQVQPRNDDMFKLRPTHTYIATNLILSTCLFSSPSCRFGVTARPADAEFVGHYPQSHAPTEPPVNIVWE